MAVDGDDDRVLGRRALGRRQHPAAPLRQHVLKIEHRKQRHEPCPHEMPPLSTRSDQLLSRRGLAAVISARPASSNPAATSDTQNTLKPVNGSVEPATTPAPPAARAPDILALPLGLPVVRRSYPADLYREA